MLDARNSRIEATPLFPNGAPAGPTAAAAWPLSLPRFVQIDAISNAPLSSLPRRDGILRLRDASGAVVAEAVFAD